MAACVIRTTTSYELILCSEEASWLSGYLQNAMNKSESERDKAFRSEIWKALSRASTFVHPPKA